MASQRAKFDAILSALEKQHGKLKPEQPTDPFGMILWEKVAYLVEDTQRAVAYKALKTHVGIDPKKIRAAPLPVLEEICKVGGIEYRKRAQRLHEVSKIVLDEFDGDLKNALKLPYKQAIKALSKFPYVGVPSAEKIMLFTGTSPVLSLESNGLRVLTRLGYGKEDKNYTKMYNSVREDIAPELPDDCKTLTRAHLMLRWHGKTICKTTMPQCGGCALVKVCPHAKKLAKLRPKPV